MIEECSDVGALGALVKMLQAPGSARTDHELNALFLGPAQRRLEALLGAGTGLT